MNKFIIFDLCKALTPPAGRNNTNINSRTSSIKNSKVIADWKTLAMLYISGKDNADLLALNNEYLSTTSNVITGQHTPNWLIDIIGNDPILKELYITIFNHLPTNIVEPVNTQVVEEPTINASDLNPTSIDSISSIPASKDITTTIDSLYTTETPTDNIYYVGNDSKVYIRMTTECFRRLIALTSIGDLNATLPYDVVPMNIISEDLSFISQIPEGQPIIVDAELLPYVVNSKSPIYVVGGSIEPELGNYLGGGGLYTILKSYRTDHVTQMDVRASLIKKMANGRTVNSLYTSDELAYVITWNSYVKYNNPTGSLPVFNDASGIGSYIIDTVRQYGDVSNILQIGPEDTKLSKLLLAQKNIFGIFLLVHEWFSERIYEEDPNASELTVKEYGDYISSYIGKDLPILAGVQILSEILIFKKLDVIVIHNQTNEASAMEYIKEYTDIASKDATIIFLNHSGSAIDGMDNTITTSGISIMTYKYDIPRLYKYNPDTLLDIGAGRSDVQHIRYMNHSGDDAYRLGDAVTQINDAVYAVKTNFKNTIAGSYIKLLEETGEVGFDNIDRAVNIHMDKYNYDTPSESEWSLFIRFGDKLDISTDSSIFAIDLLQKEGVTEVNLFTGIVYNSYKHDITSHNFKSSLLGLELLHDRFREAGITLNYKTSDNPDQDFAFLYNSRNVIILGESTFPIPIMHNVIVNFGKLYFDKEFLLQSYANMLDCQPKSDNLKNFGVLNTRDYIGILDYSGVPAPKFDQFASLEYPNLRRLINPAFPTDGGAVVAECNTELPSRQGPTVMMPPERPSVKYTTANTKVCIYSALFGGRDTFRDPIVDMDVDWVLFTDDRTITSDIWDVRYYDIPPDTSPSIFYKRFKCLPHTYLAEYDLCLWMDHNIIVTSPTFIDYVLSNFECNSLLLVNHILSDGGCNKTMTEELELSLMNIKYANEPIAKQVDAYLDNNYPNDFGMFLSGIMLYNISNYFVKSFCTNWYLDILKYANKIPQCQISLSYMIWKNASLFDAIDLDIYRNDMIVIDEERGWRRRSK